MSNFLSSMTFVLFFLLSSYGLGRFIAMLVRSEEKIGWAYTSSLGVAAWIICGGVLNLLHVVSPLTLRYSMYIGVTFAIGFSCLDFMARREGKRVTPNPLVANGPHTTPGHQKVADLSFFLLVAAVLCFTVYYLMPSKAYNLHDDFQVYLHPVWQLLSTGGFDYNLLSALGINEMGGQMFMKAFPALYFDARYANTFDAIICFTLCLGLLIELGGRIGANSGIIFISLIMFLLINPQIVNTAACYSGVLMIMGIVHACISINRNIVQNKTISWSIIIAQVIPCAIFYCSIATLKDTFIVFACSFFALNLFFDFFSQKSKKIVIKTNFATSVVSLILLVPWLLAPSTKYFSLLKTKLMELRSGAPTVAPGHHATANSFSSLWSTGDLFWGNSYPDYLAIFVVLIFGALFGLYCFSRKISAREGQAIGLISAGSLSVIICLFIFGRAIDIETALRYLSPVLIAILPVSALLVGKYFVNGSHVFFKTCGGALIAMYLLIGGMFFGSFIGRVERISQQGTLISFPMNDQYRDFMRFALGGEREKEIRSVQGRIAPGEHILAWISTPFYLDFARNKITTLEVCDFIGGAFKDEIPVDVDIATFWKFFRKLGVQYIMWEYEGPAVKDDEWYFYSEARREAFFKKTLPILANYTKVIYNKDSIAVLDIRELHLDAPNIPAKQ